MQLQVSILLQRQTTVTRTKPTPTPSPSDPCPAGWKPTVGRSVLPLTETEEEERLFAQMDRKLSQHNVQKFSQREGERYAELSPCEQDVCSHMSQWKDSRESELYQVIDSSDQELLQGPDARAQELPQWPDINDQKLSQWEEHVSSQELSQWRKDNSFKIRDIPLQPRSEEKHQPCLRLGPSPPSPKGTAVAAEAAPALLSPSPAPQSPTEQNIDREILSQVLQEIQALKQQLTVLQQVLTVNEFVVTAKKEESSVLSPHSTPSPLPAQLSSQAPREQQEEAAVGSVQARGERKEDSSEEMRCWQFLDELEPFLVRDPQLSQVSVTGHTVRISLGQGIPELALCEASVEHPAQEP